jgi:hypothetical protein
MNRKEQKKIRIANNLDRCEKFDNRIRGDKLSYSATTKTFYGYVKDHPHLLTELPLKPELYVYSPSSGGWLMFYITKVDQSLRSVTIYYYKSVERDNVSYRLNLSHIV